MGYRINVDASIAGKVKAGGKQRPRARVQAHFRHVARSVDFDSSGKLRNRHFKNEEIDPSRTHLNEGWVNDFSGGFDEAKSLDQVMGVYDKYMSGLDPNRKQRHDAVLMRGAVLSMPEQWVNEVNPNWKTEGLNAEAKAAYDALLDEFCSIVGQENVAAAFLHMDEHLPQWQLDLVKVKDGRIASSSVIPEGHDAMTAMHQRMRLGMRARGYDVELKSSERSRERLSIEEVRRLGKEREARVAAGDRSPGAGQIDTPSTKLGRIIEDALKQARSEEQFDELLSHHEVIRTRTAKGGTRYSIPRDPNSTMAKGGRENRSASKLPGKPTQAVVESRINENKLLWELEQQRLRELQKQRENDAEKAKKIVPPAPIPATPAPVAAQPVFVPPVQPVVAPTNVPPAPRSSEPVATPAVTRKEMSDFLKREQERLREKINDENTSALVKKSSSERLKTMNDEFRASGLEAAYTGVLKRREQAQRKVDRALNQPTAQQPVQPTQRQYGE